jgi:drug/metabolite transporter (DMT)-like permease
MTENSNQAHKAELHNNFLFWITLFLALPPFTLVLALNNTQTSRSQTLFIIATIWALLGGALLLVDAIRQRSQMKSSA